MPNEVFCIAVESFLATDKCPLQAGTCYWQHTETNECKFTKTELSLDGFCMETGRIKLQDDEIKSIETAIKEVLR